MPIRQQAINQLHNAESQMERKMTLIRPARFSWVTELVLTSRRRAQLWLSLFNFTAIQSHRAFHVDSMAGHWALQPAIVLFIDITAK
jgi:hypothetical protein